MIDRYDWPTPDGNKVRALPVVPRGPHWPEARRNMFGDARYAKR